MKSGVMKFEQRPMWFDIYERFPPKQEPVFKAETEPSTATGLYHIPDNVPVIFYREDWARV